MTISSNSKTYVQQPNDNWSTCEPFYFDGVDGILAENNLLNCEDCALTNLHQPCEACPITFNKRKSESNAY